MEKFIIILLDKIMLQRADLIEEIPLEDDAFFVFFLDNNGIIKSGLINSLLSFFKNKNLEGSLVLIIVK